MKTSLKIILGDHFSSASQRHLFVSSCRRDVPAEPGSKIEKHAVRYHCPMHPTVISDKPGDCPICGMRLVPMSDEKAVEQTTTSGPANLAPVTISTEVRQRMGLTLGTVEKRAIRRELRTSALIEPAEPRLHHVTTKVGGWVEQLHVSVTGQSVKSGDPLLTIYSPDLLSAQQEYLSALDSARNRPAGSPNLLAAARQAAPALGYQRRTNRSA